MWFIFELVGVGDASDLSEPQVFKNSQRMIDKTSTFVVYFTKTCTTFKFLTLDMNGKVEAEVVSFYRFQLPLPQKLAASTASSFRFHIPGYNNAKCCILPYKNIEKVKTFGVRPEFLSD